MDTPAEPDTPAVLTLDDPTVAATHADWEAAAAAVLRKARRLTEDDPDDAVWANLTRRTLDDVAVPPLGTTDLLDGLATAGRPQRAGAWGVRTWLVGSDAEAIRTAALDDLENGATSLLVQVAAGAELDLTQALRGVLLDVAPVVLDRPTPAQAAAFADLLADADPAPLPANNLSADLEAGLALPHPANDVWTEDAFVATARRARELHVLAGVVDGTRLHDQGATDAQELGWTIACGVRCLRLLAAAGFDVAEAAGLLEFRYAATDEQFPTIAKLRAARRLWARVLEASGVEPVPQRQHAITSRPMMTRYDPWTNMLRTTVAAFAAGVGGADAVTVVPFDAGLGTPDSFGRRIARNTSSLLLEESHLGVVTDPAGGAYAVEKLTDDLARAGWVEFQQVERDGGPASDAARTGVQARVRDAAERRDREVATRTRPITGVSEFPNVAETLPERDGAGFDDVRSYARAFEDLRDSPAQGSVYLATMGSVAAHTARATFAANLFAAGGVSSRNAGAHDDAAAVIADHDGEAVACLCGTDAAYADWGAELVAALRDAGVRRVVVAGPPGDLGADDACALGVDALAFLTRTREVLA